ncbi:hypothetical protein ACEU59_21585 [Buttiauxella noackiae]|uniref:hypothetical protein n=1 Tax=Buttiauxella noackiae TaxID=82992 RepID=UPI0035A57D0B
MIFEDELLHSFLFRTQKVFGFSDFRNIISNEGLLRFDVFPLAEMLELYRCFDQQSLFDVISRKGTPLINRGIIHTPKKVVSEFFIIRMQTPEYKRHKLRNLKSKYNIPSVNFCASCLLDDVREIGVGFIRHSWVHQRYCSRHNTPMYGKVLNDYKDTVRFVTAIISGEIPSDTFQYQPNHLSEVVDEALNYEPIFLMPCVFSRIQPWVEENKKEIAEKLYHSFGFKAAYIFLPRIQYIISNELLLNHLFITLISEDVAEFNLFLKERFKVKSMEFQCQTHGMFDACVMKTLEHSCLGCLHEKKYDCIG